MKPCIIIHSYSGITRGVAGRIHASCGGDLVEVVPRQRYNIFTAYTLGCIRAKNQEHDPIDPDIIDVSPYDLIVIGTPVWMYRPTPPVNAAIAALKGCENKKAVIFATCGGRPGETIPLVKKALAEKGVAVVGEMVLSRRDVNDQAKVKALIDVVRDAGAPACPKDDSLL